MKHHGTSGRGRVLTAGLALVFGAWSLVPAQAAVPLQIPIQGLLRDNAGSHPPHRRVGR